MDHKELRIVLMDHFRRFLASRKAKIDAEGPLSPAERQPLEGIIGFSEMELAQANRSASSSLLKFLRASRSVSRVFIQASPS